ncbi:cellulase M [Bellilinea caldifistulae]|uniref:Aminopeptidase n=1 Tax=Bellilinea caldifistulae TaxID=360411 RepID=A0A0P6Y418_9CHLR|nr:M42 family metallopeptidase [Bellilinea caldifistulae]KPL76345.1 aminopeptidase [Bellilinea caldifistulae]GAP12028.1 cellulase M [Bellilinea caldifistulae]
MKALIQKLVETIAPSGYEMPVRELILGEVKDWADEVRVDALGNLVVRKGQKSPSGKRIMLAAHMDEIGLIATHVDENGFVRFSTIGGVRPHTLYGGRVRFLNGVAGVIGGERLENMERVHSFDKLFIDVGATSKEDCPVRVGDVAAFERPFLDLGKRLVAKSMDDRISVAVMMETLRQLKNTPHEVYFVFSTQEEVGVRGATTAAFGVDPEIGIAVDVTATGDTPKGLKMAVALGKGPAIKVKDSGMIADPRVVRWMADTAEQAGIPYQLEILEGGSTDARAMQLTRAGVPAGCLSIPCRYIHTPSEMVDFEDVQNAVGLLKALLESPVELK